MRRLHGLGSRRLMLLAASLAFAAAAPVRSYGQAVGSSPRVGARRARGADDGASGLRRLLAGDTLAAWS